LSFNTEDELSDNEETNDDLIQKVLVLYKSENFADELEAAFPSQGPSGDAVSARVGVSTTLNLTIFV
jgi:hypothetical protein